MPPATLQTNPPTIGDKRNDRHVHDLYNVWRGAFDAVNRASSGADQGRLMESADRAYEAYIDAEAAETYAAYRRLMGLPRIHETREA